MTLISPLSPSAPITTIIPTGGDMTTTAHTADTTPRVWIGCLACYNAGSLVGDWFDAATADEVTLADVHEGSGLDCAECEELWVFDHENIPVRGEFGVLEATEWGGVYEEAGGEQWPAVYAWVESGSYVAEGTGDLPSISDFEESYCGAWESFEDYAREVADLIGLLTDVPEEIANYFDWDSWTRDLGFDYRVHDNPEGGVFVFRNM